MPIFEFKCTKCGKEFEVLAITYNEKTTEVLPCIECEEPAGKVISASAFKVNGANSANGYASHGKEVTMDDFDDAHKWNARTTAERKRGVESFD